MSEHALLALDTSTPSGSVAVGLGEKILAEVTLDARAGHSSALLPAADFAIRAAGLTTRDIRGVVVGSGPGSFTGLRIAGATAKGLVHALDVPLFAYSSLLAAAAPHLTSGRGAVASIFDARGRDVFVGCYRLDASVIACLQPVALSLEDAILELANAEATLLVGDGAAKHAGELERALKISIISSHFSVPRAGALIWLAQRYPDLGRVTDPRAWEPDYLRPSGAERIAAQRAAVASTVSHA